MCEAVGLPVTRLHRPRYDGLELGDLAPAGRVGGELERAERRSRAAARELTDA